MRTLLMAGAAALSMAIMPTATMAQADVPGSTNSVDDKRSDHAMTFEQKQMYDSWPAERRADYDTWPGEYQVYYWGLEPAYQTGYWALTPDQRARIYAMSEAQQQAAWESIAKQLNTETPSTAMPETPDATTNYVSNTMVQGNRTASAPAEYPVCRGEVQDSCINPRAAGMNWGNRPLDYWPGQPASKM